MKTVIAAAVLAFATIEAAHAQGKWIEMVSPEFYPANSSSYQAVVNTLQFDDAHQCDVAKTALEYILKNNYPQSPGIVWCAYVPGLQ